jgi:hypothetical protein
MKKLSVFFLLVVLYVLPAQGQQCRWFKDGKDYWQGTEFRDGNNIYKCQCTKQSQFDPSLCHEWKFVIVETLENPQGSSTPSVQTVTNWSATQVEKRFDELSSQIKSLKSSLKSAQIDNKHQTWELERKLSDLTDKKNTKVILTTECHDRNKGIITNSRQRDQIVGYSYSCDRTLCKLRIPPGWAVHYSAKFRTASGDSLKMSPSTLWLCTDSNDIIVDFRDEFHFEAVDWDRVINICLTVRPIPQVRSDQVIIYEGFNLNGAYKVLSPGKYRLADFAFSGIESVAMSLGSKIELFSDEDFTDKILTRTKSNSKNFGREYHPSDRIVNFNKELKGLKVKSIIVY